MSNARLAALVEEAVPIGITQTPVGDLKWYGFGKMAWKRPTWNKAQYRKPGSLSIEKWIEGIKPKSIFWDIGANIGVYTLYAAARGISVVAFEPEAGSFFVLQKNLDLNGFHDRVTALNLAVSDRSGIQAFKLSSQLVGTAQHSLSNDSKGLSRKVMTTTGLGLIPFLPKPTHIKIDVDGNEVATVSGLRPVLDSVESVVVEMRDPGEAEVIANIMRVHGLTTKADLGDIDQVTDVFFARDA